jgi:hypothetical protein
MGYKEEALDFLGITEWHNAGYTGKGIKILSDEKVCEKYHSDVISPAGFKSKRGHGDDVMSHIKLVAPDAEFIAYPFSGTFGNGEYECDSAEYIKENKVHVFTTSEVGSYPSKSKQQAMQDCIDAGCIFFASAVICPQCSQRYIGSTHVFLILLPQQIYRFQACRMYLL